MNDQEYTPVFYGQITRMGAGEFHQETLKYRKTLSDCDSFDIPLPSHGQGFAHLVCNDLSAHASGVEHVRCSRYTVGTQNCHYSFYADESALEGINGIVEHFAIIAEFHIAQNREKIERDRVRIASLSSKVWGLESEVEGLNAEISDLRKTSWRDVWNRFVTVLALSLCKNRKGEE